MNKLSKREISLIIILVNLIGYYILFNVIGLSISNMNKNKLEQYEELKAQQDILEIENMKNQVDTENLEIISQKNTEMKNKIFSKTNSENIHYFISQVAQKSNVTLSSINIENLMAEETNEDLSVEQSTVEEVSTEQSSENVNSNEQNITQTEIKDEAYNIDIELIGKYEDIVNFIKNIESYEKTISITDFNTTLQDGTTNSKIKMNIYTITKEKNDNEFIIN